ncbi:hypothetical protein [Paraburkholderia saeva]|uniref:hypothetical protein n=1 Tax=Paraburkholderia saeva TaxID=2777537 RepID=UPI001DA41BDB|nr:hypothetical protein [Paraburkholderia saeva]CAG4892167.1 hypothetical protein R70241_01274 [Paraburkholderia saeva]
MATTQAPVAAGPLPKARQSALLPERALPAANARRAPADVRRDRGRHGRKAHRRANVQPAASGASAAFPATVRRDAMVRAALRRVGPKETARRVRLTATAIAVTALRVVLKANVRRAVSKANATEPIDRRGAPRVNARRVRSTVTAIAAIALRVVLKANARRAVSTASATEPIARRGMPKANVPAANAPRAVSKASAPRGRLVRKVNAGHTAQRHVPAMM